MKGGAIKSVALALATAKGALRGVLTKKTVTMVNTSVICGMGLPACQSPPSQNVAPVVAYGSYVALALRVFRALAGEPCFPCVGLLLPMAKEPVDLIPWLAKDSTTKEGCGKTKAHLHLNFPGVLGHFLNGTNVRLNKIQIRPRLLP